MDSANRVILNTSAQFMKTFIGGIITLYSSRIILLNLGENDFGIYSLIAGIILMLSFITNALSSTTQRFISYNHTNSELSKILSNSVFIHIILGTTIFLILLLFIPILFDGFLNISEDRVPAAKYIYITVLISVFITFVTSPYKAVLIAHENIVYISIIDIIDAVLKLVIAFSLDKIYYDRLEYYGTLLMLIQFLNFGLITIYAFKHYEECVIPNFSHIKRIYISKLSAFAGWNIYGLGCNIGRTQGLSIVINKFLGTTANAAYGIGLQISSYVNYMSESLLNAIRPQIVKSEGINNRNRMFRLSMVASKFSFFLLSWLSIPCIFLMPEILKIWLKEPPEYSIIFSRMFLLSGLVDSVTIGLHISNQAIGNLKKFVLMINSLKLMVLPLSIIAFYYTDNVFMVALIYVLVEFLSAIIRIFLLKKDGLIVHQYFKNVFGKIFAPLVICLLINCTSLYFINCDYKLFVTFVMSFVCYGVAIYFLGISKQERIKINGILKMPLNLKK